jgi:L-alanine-DL-glutamate epimerase-like enolase superfamily enzyme
MSGYSQWKQLILSKELEEFRPFFIEDPFSPENNRYFKLLREILRFQLQWANCLTARMNGSTQ